MLLVQTMINKLLRLVLTHANFCYQYCIANTLLSILHYQYYVTNIFY